jgi:hypothetical protein
MSESQVTASAFRRSKVKDGQAITSGSEQKILLIKTVIEGFHEK